jgi:hypothetical protein
MVLPVAARYSVYVDDARAQLIVDKFHTDRGLSCGPPHRGKRNSWQSELRLPHEGRVS